MRINLKSNFEVAGIFETGHIDLPRNGLTLRQLLEELSRRSLGTMEIIRPRTQEVNPEDFTVAVNGRDYPFLPQRLDTALRDGDTVEVMITVLGGG